MSFRPARRGAALLFAAALAAGAIAAPAAAAIQQPGNTLVVNSNGDTEADDGSCTLREAITSANANTASGATAGECIEGSPGAADTITRDHRRRRARKQQCFVTNVRRAVGAAIHQFRSRLAAAITAAEAKRAPAAVGEHLCEHDDGRRLSGAAEREVAHAQHGQARLRARLRHAPRGDRAVDEPQRCEELGLRACTAPPEGRFTHGELFDEAAIA